MTILNIPYADRGTRDLAAAITAYATKTALKAVPANLRKNGDLHRVVADGSTWWFDDDSTAADTTENLVLTPSSGSGRWLRADALVDIKIPISFNQTDGEDIFTVPASLKGIHILQTWWEVTTGWTGGTSSAIGLSSTNSAYATKGDLLGGAGGDVAATLVTGGIVLGTLGAKFASSARVALVAGDHVEFDRVASAFTAGAGFAHLLAHLNPA